MIGLLDSTSIAPRTQVRGLRPSCWGQAVFRGLRHVSFLTFWPCFLACLGFQALGASVDSLKRFQFAEPHMGTLWTITCFAESENLASNACVRAFRRVEALERVMTDYDSESELMRLCRAPVGVPHGVSADLFAVLKQSQQSTRITGGAFDVTVGPLVQLWRRARRQRELPEAAAIEEAKSRVGWDKVRLDSGSRTVTLKVAGMRLDLGGIGKGFAADAALKELRRSGVRRAMVAASGDIAIGDPPPGKAGWKIRIGDPGSRSRFLPETLILQHAGVSTSGDMEQFVELNGVRFSHIVDPRTGLGLTNRVQVTVVAETATHSDSLDTAICIMGLKAGLRMIDADRRLSMVAWEPHPSGQGFVPTRSRRFLALPQTVSEE